MSQACWKEGEEKSGHLQRSPVEVRNNFLLLEKEGTAVQRACRVVQQHTKGLQVPEQRMYEK